MIGVHPGEFIVGEYIEKNFKGLNIWLPAKDTGVDLLVTNKANTKSVSIQVKSSKDYNHLGDAESRSGSFFSVKRAKIEKSLADIWIFVQQSTGTRRHSYDYIILTPKDFLAKLDEVHGFESNYKLYFEIRNDGRVWLTRGIQKSKKQDMFKGHAEYSARELVGCLNNWESIQSL